MFFPAKNFSILGFLYFFTPGITGISLMGLFSRSLLILVRLIYHAMRVLGIYHLSASVLQPLRSLNRQELSLLSSAMTILPILFPKMKRI